MTNLFTNKKLSIEVNTEIKRKKKGGKEMEEKERKNDTYEK